MTGIVAHTTGLLSCPFCAAVPDEGGFTTHKSTCFFMVRAMGRRPEERLTAWNKRVVATRPLKELIDAGYNQFWVHTIHGWEQLWLSRQNKNMIYDRRENSFRETRLMSEYPAIPISLPAEIEGTPNERI